MTRIFLKTPSKGKLAIIAGCLMTILVITELDLHEEYDTEDYDIETDNNTSKCAIPKLDPFHPDVMPLYQATLKDSCAIKRYGRVENNIYTLDMRGVKTAMMAYIKRVDDFANQMPTWFPLKPEAGSVSQVVEAGQFRVIITFDDSRQHEEFHAVLPPPSSIPDESSDPRPNIVLIMIDSISHANAQRHLKKTYGRLQEDPNTIILQGHTIAGDGTTAQVGAFLTGIPEQALPEARKSFRGAETVDRYPFLFNELHQKGYETYFSEDSPGMGTFNYRLMGWKDPPTKVYLRPMWIEMDDFLRKNHHKVACNHEIAFEVTKRFMLEYPASTPKFAFPMVAGLAHGKVNNAGLIDDDLIDLYDFFEDKGFTKNSFVFLFADHGARMGEIRGTMQGKLEERLPFMAITTPKYFKDEYPEYMENLRKNAQKLTSHFDFHETMRHIVELKSGAYKSLGKLGKSLFTEIPERSCIEVGTESHWCPCLKFQTLSVDGDIVKAVAEEMVKTINAFFDESLLIYRSCTQLTLKSIQRASRRVPSREMQQFDSSKRNEQCDSCGVVSTNRAKPKFFYEIVFTVQPSQARFEATAEVALRKKQTVIGEMRVDKGFSRINKYGDQPACIAEQHPHLRKYCLCRHNTQSSSKPL